MTNFFKKLYKCYTKFSSNFMPESQADEKPLGCLNYRKPAFGQSDHVAINNNQK